MHSRAGRSSHAFARIFNDAAEFETKRGSGVAAFRLLRQQAGGRHDVAEIEPGRIDAHAHLCRAWGALVRFLPAQRVDAARAVLPQDEVAAGGQLGRPPRALRNVFAAFRLET